MSLDTLRRWNHAQFERDRRNRGPTRYAATDDPTSVPVPLARRLDHDLDILAERGQELDDAVHRVTPRAAAHQLACARSVIHPCAHLGVSLETPARPCVPTRSAALDPLSTSPRAPRARSPTDERRRPRDRRITLQRGVQFWVQAAWPTRRRAVGPAPRFTSRHQQPAGFTLDCPGFAKAWSLEGIGSSGWTRSR